jgi:hypothetical protein
MQLNLTPFPVMALGKVRAEVTIDGQIFLASSIRFVSEAGPEGMKIERQVAHRF